MGTTLKRQSSIRSQKINPTTRDGKKLNPAAVKKSTSALVRKKSNPSKPANNTAIAKDARAIKKKIHDLKIVSDSRLQVRKSIVPSSIFAFKALLVQSADRVPLDYDRVLAQTARITGFLLVLAGSFASIWHLHAIFPSPFFNQQAQVLMPTPGEMPSRDAFKSLLLREPIPDIIIPNSPISNVVPVRVQVEKATAVRLSAFFKNKEIHVPLGSARNNSGEWLFDWDTRLNQNGDYALKLLITNEHGSYEYTFTSNIQIENSAPAPVTASEPTPAPISTDDATNTTIDSISTPLRYTYDRANKKITLSKTYPEVASNDVIRIYISQPDSDVKFLLAESFLFSLSYQRYNVLWRHSVDVSRFAAGQYIITTEHHRGREHIDSDSLSLSLSHTVDGRPLSLTGNSAVSLSGVDNTLAHIQVENATQLQSFADVLISTFGAISVDVYAVNTASVNQIYLGGAKQVNSSTWVFNWDTTQIPNSQYHIFARVTSPRGTYEGNRLLVTVKNQRYSQIQESQLRGLEQRNVMYQALVEGTIFATENFWNLSQITDAPLIVDFVLEMATQLDAEFQRYAVALRTKNENLITSANSNLRTIEEEFMLLVASETNASELVSAFRNYIDQTKKRIESDVEKIEVVMNEREHEGAFIDSDYDGISDFDEMYIYGTNPFQADTSGNGIPDGVAILNGLNPLSTEMQDSIVFESPLDIGVIREDILQVHDIVAVPVEEYANYPDSYAPAVITGTALPNSFVTLYIFSSPVIVTVKTEPDGSWQYRFEKELPDGEHTVFVAFTDSSGTIVARSLPFFFVKEARAYLPLGGSYPELEGRRIQEATDAFWTSNMIYVVMAFAVVAIGLVLMMIGMFVEHRRRKMVQQTEISI